MRRIFLAVLINQFVFCDSKIHLHVYTAPTKKEVRINYQGKDIKVVTALEEEVFNTTKENLKKGIGIELGRMPVGVFLTDPTRYGNLHKEFSWMPVMRTLKVKSVEVLDVTSVNVVVKSQEHINKKTKMIKSQAALSQTAESVVLSFWSDDGLPEDEIYFDVVYCFNGRGVKFHNLWRHDNFLSASLPFGVNKTGYVKIEPGQKVTYRLRGSKTIIQIKIQYVASLIGQVVTYFNVYGQYHFLAPKVDDIMKAAGLKNEIITTEQLEVQCYVKPELDIFDSDTKKPLKVHTPFVFRP